MSVPSLHIESTDSMIKCKNISIQMLKDIGMVVPKIIETKSNTNVHITCVTPYYKI